jgi:1-acyl-sn-glycerol-3-phosphate acyltransferase
MVVPGLIGLTGWITVLIGTVRLMLLTLLLRKWPDTGLTPLVLTLVLSRLLALALGFELQVGGPENIWLISVVVLQPHTPVMIWRYITFGDGE